MPLPEQLITTATCFIWYRRATGPLAEPGQRQTALGRCRLLRTVTTTGCHLRPAPTSRITAHALYLKAKPPACYTDRPEMPGRVRIPAATCNRTCDQELWMKAKEALPASKARALRLDRARHAPALGEMTRPGEAVCHDSERSSGTSSVVEVSELPGGCPPLLRLEAFLFASTYSMNQDRRVATVPTRLVDSGDSVSDYAVCPKFHVAT